VVQSTVYGEWDNMFDKFLMVIFFDFS